jgi:hypothetical protein
MRVQECSGSIGTLTVNDFQQHETFDMKVREGKTGAHIEWRKIDTSRGRGFPNARWHSQYHCTFIQWMKL